MISEGTVSVPGAVLQYRRAGADFGPLLVFENGWGASHHYWAWIERELAPHARLLFYDRAGIGGSELITRQTAPSLSAQFQAMLLALQISEPVVVVGHSYGGLIGALHLSQQPQVIQALIQLDASPWQRDRVLDASFAVIGFLVYVLKFYAAMGWRDPIFAPACGTLPEPEQSQLLKHSFGSIKSLRAAASELGLLKAIRLIIESAPSDTARLILSATESAEPKKSAIVRRMQAQHRQYAHRGKGGEWSELAFGHGAMVFTEAGAAAVASRILTYLRGSQILAGERH